MVTILTDVRDCSSTQLPSMSHTERARQIKYGTSTFLVVGAMSLASGAPAVSASSRTVPGTEAVTAVAQTYLTDQDERALVGRLTRPPNWD